jgi:hypothetical protein
MSAPYQFSIPDAGLAVGDGSFIISVFDASLPYLKSIESQAQWGSIPFSQRPGWIQETQRQVRESTEHSRISSDITEVLKDMHSRVSSDGRYFVSVGFAFVRGNWFPSYLPAVTVAQAGKLGLEECLYIEVMVSDPCTKNLFRGIGAALL